MFLESIDRLVQLIGLENQRCWRQWRTHSAIFLESHLLLSIFAHLSTAPQLIMSVVRHNSRLMELSVFLLISSPVGLLAALVLILFAFTTVEARKQSKRSCEASKEEVNPPEVIAAIEDDLSEAYDHIPEEYRDDIINNISQLDSLSSQPEVSRTSRRESVSALIGLMVSPASASEERITEAIGALHGDVGGGEEEDELGEERRTSWPPASALRRRKRSIRVGSLHIIPERKQMFSQE